jgi:uncharacterized glyoxalase superfamily protein PhnB
MAERTPENFELRAQPESLRGRELGASLTVRDLQKSVAWYRDVLGFTLDRMHERGGKTIAASLKAGDVRVLLSQDDGSKGWDRAKGQGISLQITTAQNVDEIAAHLEQRGAVLDTKPVTTPWGARVFRLTDPDGFKLVISSGQ